MRNLSIVLAVFLAVVSPLLSQPVSRQEFDALKARVTALENSSQKNDVYHVRVDYDLLFEEAVKLGKYDWFGTDPDITSKHFSSTRTGKAEVDIEIKHFNKNMRSDDVIAELDKMGLRPADAQELCALGAQYPELQRQFSIIALGSVWYRPGGFQGVPVLFCDYGSRRLSFVSFDYSLWLTYHRFAAVRK